MSSLARRARTTALVAGVGLVGLAASALAGPDVFTADRSQPLAASDARRAQQPLDDLLFPLDQAVLDPAALLQLAAEVRWLADHPEYRLVAEGRADSSGSPDHNADLALRRAEIVKNHLVGSGVDPDRIVVAVYGENGAHPRPVALDRRAVMFASTEAIPQLVTAELDRDAIEVVWTHRGARLRETRGITPVMAASRR